MILQKTFSLTDFTASDKAKELGIDNTQISDEHFENLKKTHALLIDLRERLSTKYGKPINININSGYRCPELNKAVRGVKTSQHCLGQAADTVALGLSIDDYFECIKALAKNNTMVFGQVIHEFNRWIHISIPTPGKVNQFMKTVDGKNYVLESWSSK